jgi:hypothetical protein
MEERHMIEGCAGFFAKHNVLLRTYGTADWFIESDSKTFLLFSQTIFGDNHK